MCVYHWERSDGGNGGGGGAIASTHLPVLASFALLSARYLVHFRIGAA